jgi:hypothetical protein
MDYENKKVYIKNKINMRERERETMMEKKK